jgi:transcriptional regulator of acetoin/glycerol metabolism
LGLLIGQLLKQNQSNATIAPDAVRSLYHYDWPLNVRELAHALNTAAALAGSDPIQRQHLPHAIQDPSQRVDTPDLSSEQQEHKEQVIALLRKHAGNVSAVARETGKARTQVQRWMKRYNLKPTEFQ